MEKIFEIARNFRLVLVVIGVAALIICSYASAFLPPDLVPHPHIPDAPTKPGPSYPDDHISKR